MNLPDLVLLLSYLFLSPDRLIGGLEGDRSCLIDRIYPHMFLVVSSGGFSPEGGYSFIFFFLVWCVEAFCVSCLWSSKSWFLWKVGKLTFFDFLQVEEARLLGSFWWIYLACRFWCSLFWIDCGSYPSSFRILFRHNSNLLLFWHSIWWSLQGWLCFCSFSRYDRWFFACFVAAFKNLTVIFRLYFSNIFYNIYEYAFLNTISYLIMLLIVEYLFQLTIFLTFFFTTLAFCFELTRHFGFA